MTGRYCLNLGSQETRQLVAWMAERAERDHAELEQAGIGHVQSNYLRGRISVWRALQALGEPPRETTIDGRAV